MDNERKLHIVRSPNHGKHGVQYHGEDGEYQKFATDIGGLVCTKCHKEILEGQKVISINVGVESAKYPMAQYLRFTGLSYHAGTCLKIKDLPGIEERDEIDEEFEGTGAIRVCPQSKMTN